METKLKMSQQKKGHAVSFFGCWRLSGFTLAELMIVMAIIGIIAAIAYPSYTESIRKSRRTTATTALIDLAAREEKFYTLNNAYTANLTVLGYSNAATVSLPDAVSTYYNMTITVVAADPINGIAATFTATATPAASQASDSCGTYTLTNLGQQGAAKTSCW